MRRDTTKFRGRFPLHFFLLLFLFCFFFVCISGGSLHRLWSVRANQTRPDVRRAEKSPSRRILPIVSALVDRRTGIPLSFCLRSHRATMGRARFSFSSFSMVLLMLGSTAHCSNLFRSSPLSLSRCCLLSPSARNCSAAPASRAYY